MSRLENLEFVKDRNTTFKLFGVDCSLNLNLSKAFQCFPFASWMQKQKQLVISNPHHHHCYFQFVICYFPSLFVISTLLFVISNYYLLFPIPKSPPHHCYFQLVICYFPFFFVISNSKNPHLWGLYEDYNPLHCVLMSRSLCRNKFGYFLTN